MQQTHKLDLLISVICFLNSTISCTLDLHWRPCYYVWLSTKQFDLQLNDVLWESVGIGEIHISMTPNSVTNDRVNILCKMKLDSWAPWLRFNLIYKWQRCLTFDNLVNDPVPQKCMIYMVVLRNKKSNVFKSSQSIAGLIKPSKSRDYILHCYIITLKLTSFKTGQGNEWE